MDTHATDVVGATVLTWLAGHRWLALAGAALSGAFVVSGVVSVAVIGSRDTGLGSLVSAAGLAAAFSGMGALLAWRVPHNPIGWLFTAAGLVWGAGALAVWPDHVYHSGHHTLSLAQRLLLADIGSWPLLVVPSIQLPLLYLPDGRLRSPRWRIVVRAVTTAMVTTSVALTVAPGDIEGYPGVANPLGLPGGKTAVTVVVIAGAVVLFAAALAATVGLVLRYRASHGIERQQLRWVALGGVVVMLTLATGGFVQGRLGLVVGLGFAAVPLTIGVAVLRYRLYDLGRIVSRTVTYAALTASLAGVYVGIAAAGGAIAGGSGFGVAAATLVAAALFRPLRSRLQSAVDRRFNRARYDAAVTADRFSARLRTQLAPESVRADLLTTVAGAVEPASISVWLPRG